MLKHRRSWTLALCVAAGAASAGAQADTTVSADGGGLHVSTDGGNFQFNISGRIFVDYATVIPGGHAGWGSTAQGSPASAPGVVGSPVGYQNNSGVYFRRANLDLTGKIYQWSYRMEDNLSGNGGGTAADGTNNPNTGASGTGTGNDWRYLYIAHPLLQDGIIYIGQNKPYRSLEELTHDRDLLFMERPITTASGVLGGRDLQDGAFYAWSRGHVLSPLDNLFLGVSGYSLRKISQSTTEGVGANARIAYAPINAKGELLHFGLSYSSDHSDNAIPLTDNYRYGGYRLGSGTLSQSFIGSTANPTIGPSSSADTVEGEFIGMWGPAYLAGEYAHVQASAQSTTPGLVTQAFYVQASYFLTGESKLYNAKEAITYNPYDLRHGYGAFELKARYEQGQTGDLPEGNTTICAPSTGSIPKGTQITKCEVSDYAVGMNYYPNAWIRFMLDYIVATDNLGAAGKDKPQTLAFRAQVAF